MVAMNKFNCFTEDLAEGGHNLATNQLKALLTNTAPVATNTVVGGLVDITAVNGYTAGGLSLTVAGSAQTSGVYKLTLNDVTLTASGGPVGPFRYVVIYNSTNGKLIGWYDYGASITLQSGEPFTVDFDGANGVLTIGG